MIKPKSRSETTPVPARKQAPVAFSKQWSEVPVDIREALENGGFQDPPTLAKAAEWDNAEDVRCMAQQLELSEDSVELCMTLLPALAAAAAAGPARRADEKLAAVPRETITVAAVMAKRKQEADASAAVPKKKLDLGVPATAPRMRWPTKLRKARESEAGPDARAAAEQRERERWVTGLIEVLNAAGLPIVEQAEAAADPTAVMRLAAAGLRASTLRKRVRTWRHIRAWLGQVYGVTFPASIDMFLDYLRTRAEEPCAKSVLQGAMSALAFMESAGRVEGEEALATQKALRSGLAELELGLLAAAGPGPARQAPRFPTQILVELEETVMCVDKQAYPRAFAWWTLVSVWAALRFDDHRGMVPVEVHRRLFGMEFELVRTSSNSIPNRRRCTSTGTKPR